MYQPPVSQAPRNVKGNRGTKGRNPNVDMAFAQQQAMYNYQMMNPYFQPAMYPAVSQYDPAYAMINEQQARAQQQQQPQTTTAQDNQQQSPPTAESPAASETSAKSTTPSNPPTRRARKAIAIVDPNTNEVVNKDDVEKNDEIPQPSSVKATVNDSGYPSEASTPTSMAPPASVSVDRPKVIQQTSAVVSAKEEAEAIVDDATNEACDTPTEATEIKDEKSKPNEEKPKGSYNDFFSSIIPEVSTINAMKPTDPSLEENRYGRSDSDSSTSTCDGPALKRNYSRDLLLELRSASPSRVNARIPKDIVVTVSPLARQKRTPAEELLRELRGTLNKMTAENNDKMTLKIYNLLSQDERLDVLPDKPQLFNDFVGIIFQKAISEPTLAAIYAKMFTYLNQVSILALIKKCDFIFIKPFLRSK